MKRALYLTLALTSFENLLGESLSNIVIVGNKRIEPETIKSYLSIKIGEEFSEADADTSLKSLFDTGYFEDVKVIKKGTSLHIEVKENPIVNQIAYEGNSSLKDDQLEKELSIRPRKILSRTDIQNAQQRILEMYRRMGRFNAKVSPKIIRLDNNRVDLVFEIVEGDVTNIEKIIFIGNKTFSKTRLEEEILSKRWKFWRFFANDDTYDPDRLMADQQALRQFYANNGHPDFRIINAVAELSPDRKDFCLTFTFEEGDYFAFDDVAIQSAIKDIDIKSLQKEVSFSNGDMYSAKEIEKTVNAITDALGDKGYAFVSVDPVITKDREKKTAKISFEIKEGPRIYVEKITIKGNDKTHDNVIRREMTIHEGDAYNTSKIKQSETKIKDLGYFKVTSVETEQGSEGDQAHVVINVEEQPTGEFKLSGGYSTMDGIIGNVGFSQKNFMGKGQTVHADFSMSKRTQEFNVGILEPYMFNRPLSGSIDLFSQSSSRMEAFTTKSNGMRLGLGYHLTVNFIQSWNYLIKSDDITGVEQNASQYIKDDPRKLMMSAITHSLRYDKRDSAMETTRGYLLSMSNTYSGLGGTVHYIRNDFSATAFYTPMENILTFARGEFGFILPVQGRRLRISDSIYLGGDSFKGFQFGGLGPRDSLSRNKDALGGKKYWKGTLEAQFPIGLPVDFGIKGALFTQFGALYDCAVKGQNGVVDDKFIRQSVGGGIIWKGPFGPLRIDYAVATRKKAYDVTQTVNLSYQLPF
ncbi:MAG: outer membrane protein assembly factor BamA [Proteobacteria bacterium]|nr:outer membrane protein assembly factor BamA [Pseudomonadota bacterium]